MANYVVAITGGSGVGYARLVLKELMDAGHDVFAVVSDAGRRVMSIETGPDLTGVVEADERQLQDWIAAADRRGTLRLCSVDDVAAPIASGSFPTAGMVIVPCSSGTLARVAHGMSRNLIERAADVTLKERRRLVLVPRETPLSLIHLRNMTAVTEAGAIVLPPSPGFYHNPGSVQDLVDMIAGRILHHLGVESDLSISWQGPEPAELAGFEDL